ncbi:hypothetical protein BDP27DRAFT_1424766 [Rhodocollybia butyracea]|uniref:Uncharacterized protein n=1 Tax=Rhodocollybia butyracea TaxID=206335 RepID=A0A9P5PL93_9AGAR|nr:hypothetical protein BDP27DRAFT_1424766 [Rhodocollybia butyracea]
MSTDIFLEYLIDSNSSMPIYLDEEMLSELEASWHWHHITLGSLESAVMAELILQWTRDTLAEPDILGIEDSEFEERLAKAIKSEIFLANIRAINLRCSPQGTQNNALFGFEYVLLSGKLGDPEDFLDTNVLPILDAVKILYDDWYTLLIVYWGACDDFDIVRIVLKEYEIASSTELYLSLNNAVKPLSNVTNTQDPPEKRWPLSTDETALMKRRKHFPAPTDHVSRRTSLTRAKNSCVVWQAFSKDNNDAMEGWNEIGIQRLVGTSEDLEYVENSGQAEDLASYRDSWSFDSELSQLRQSPGSIFPLLTSVPRSPVQRAWLRQHPSQSFSISSISSSTSSIPSLSSSSSVSSIPSIFSLSSSASLFSLLSSLPAGSELSSATDTPMTKIVLLSNPSSNDDNSSGAQIHVALFSTD